MLSNTQMDAAASSPLFRGLEREEITRLLEELKIHPVAVPKAQQHPHCALGRCGGREAGRRGAERYYQ